jgi:hypothetical protein
MALEKEPHRRYGSAREMLNAMERIRGNASADAPGEVRPALRVHVSNRLTEGIGSPATPEKVRTQSGERRGAIFAPQEKAWIAVTAVLLAALSDTPGSPPNVKSTSPGTAFTGT